MLEGLEKGQNFYKYSNNNAKFLLKYVELNNLIQQQ